MLFRSSRDLRLLFRAADHIVRYEFSHNYGARVHGGNPPRYRTSSGMTKNAPAPCGLPRCCYDNTWYNALRESDRRLLGAVDIPCKLTLPATYGYMFKNVTLPAT